jgi:hypothetical protein
VDRGIVTAGMVHLREDVILGGLMMRKRIRYFKFSLLLAALFLLLIVAPLVEGTRASGMLFTIALTAVFITGVVANREQKWVFRGGLAVAAIAIPISWAALFNKSAPLDLSQYLIVVVFCGVTAGMILIAIFRKYVATAEAVMGAICVYLLIGLTWAMIYSSIEYVQEEPFRFPDRRRSAVVGVDHTSFSQLTYFSFVTLSTLGYGDITPRTPLAETACWMESIVGQLYIAILIARLVSAIPPMNPAANESKR